MTYAKNIRDLGVDLTGADRSVLYRPMTMRAIEASGRIAAVLEYWSSLVIAEGGRETPSVAKRSRKGFEKFVRCKGFPKELANHFGEVHDQLASFNSCASLAVARFLIVADRSRPVYLQHKDFLVWTVEQEVPLFVNLEKFAQLVRSLECFRDINE